MVTKVENAIGSSPSPRRWNHLPPTKRFVANSSFAGSMKRNPINLPPWGKTVALFSITRSWREAGHDACARALRRARVLAFTYCTLEGAATQRSVWPILLGYDNAHCLLIGWCEQRDAIRHFRVERMSGIRVLERKPPRRRHELLRIWQEMRRCGTTIWRPRSPTSPSDLNSVEHAVCAVK